MSGFYAPPASASAGPAILLVDDEVAILDGLRRQLRRNFTVHTATGGAEALQLLETEPLIHRLENYAGRGDVAGSICVTG